MSDAVIILDYSNRTAAFTDIAKDAKSAALEVSGMIGRVDSAEENANAVEAQKGIKEVLKLIETARETCKRPIIDIGRAIETAANTMKADLEREQLRLGKLCGDFQTLELAKQRAAEAARRLEEEKLQRAQEAEERRIREEAEAKARQLREEELKAQQAAANARNEHERAKAEALQHEIDRQKALAVANTHAELEAVQERTNAAASMLPEVKQASKAEGQSVEEVWVIDQIREFELMKARPDLIRKVEFDLVALKSLLKAGVKLPGVQAHKEIAQRIRSSKPGMVLAV